MSWLDGLLRHANPGSGCVVVIVASVRGSAPLGRRVDTGNTPMGVPIAAAADVSSTRALEPRGRRDAVAGR